MGNDAAAKNEAWTGWRGPRRDGVVAWLPERLPSKTAIRWTKRLSNRGLAGVAATEEVVVVADRDPADTMDVFRCLSAADGSERWTIRYLAPGELDYGNASRSTPLINGDHVILAGAEGHLTAVDLAKGKVLWRKEFRRDFGGGKGASGGNTGAIGGTKSELPWGFCSSPLIVDDKLIVNPGGKDASLVALKPSTGDVIWKSPGGLPGHGSMIVATLGGKPQIVGYDKTSLGGWDVESGARLWSLSPKVEGDFNVPTPIVWRDKLVVTTENNGTRMYNFAADGKIVPEPVATAEDLSPDSHTPVLLGDRLLGVHNGLHCLDLANGLKTLWKSDDRTFHEYASLIASSERYLVTTLRGELILCGALADKYRPLSRLQLFEDDEGVYSHPALVGKRLYVRGSKALVCVDLGADSAK